MFVVSVALTGLGFLIAWRMDSTQGFHAIMSVFLLPMWLLSGAFFPMDVGGWLGWIIRINPLTYGVAGLRYYLQNVDVATAHLPSPARVGSYRWCSRACCSPPIAGLPASERPETCYEFRTEYRDADSTNWN